jgi:D-glycero-alpha-D-manno-heptose 1-phosphate guanylyltransferase
MTSSAIVLAGGLGTRLRSTVPDLPKPMAPIGPRPFLEHQLDYWIAQGITHFVLSVGYRREIIMNHFGHCYHGARLDYAIEETPLGTGGGLLLAVEKIDSDRPFLLLNGDTYFAVDLPTLDRFSGENAADWTFSLFRTNEEGRYMGMDVSSQGQILSLKSGSSQPGRLANGGVYRVRSRAALGKQFIPGSKVSLEDDIFPAAMASGQRMFGIEFPGTFIDIGVPDDYRRAPALLINNVTLSIKETT